MNHRSAFCLYAALAAVLLTAAPALAQFKPRPIADPATGEKYHIEGGVGFWNPSAQMSISSESLGIIGSSIDFKKDLGLTDTRFSEFHLTARPATKHKFRFQLIPIDYVQKHTLTRTIVFNGQAYTVGVPVTSELNWQAFRLAYEYDFLYHDRWFVGFVADAKYTNVKAQLTTAVVTEFAHAQAPVPTLGGIGRYYVAPNIAITGELTGMKFPDSVSDRYRAHYLDFDLNGTVNFTNNVGAQVGYRSFDVGYKFDNDDGSFVLKGLYFGIVARY